MTEKRESQSDFSLLCEEFKRKTEEINRVGEESFFYGKNVVVEQPSPKPACHYAKTMKDVRYYLGKARVLILHKHGRKAQIKFLEDYTHIYKHNPAYFCSQVRHFKFGETCVTLVRFLWRKRRLNK